TQSVHESACEVAANDRRIRNVRSSRNGRLIRRVLELGRITDELLAMSCHIIRTRESKGGWQAAGADLPNPAAVEEKNYFVELAGAQNELQVVQRIKGGAPELKRPTGQAQVRSQVALAKSMTAEIEIKASSAVGADGAKNRRERIVNLVLDGAKRVRLRDDYLTILLRQTSAVSILINPLGKILGVFNRSVEIPEAWIVVDSDDQRVISILRHGSSPPSLADQEDQTVLHRTVLIEVLMAFGCAPLPARRIIRRLRENQPQVGPRAG